MIKKNLTIDDIKALEDIINLVKKFTDKNPLRKRNINYKSYKQKLGKLKSITNEDNQYKFDSFMNILNKLKSIVRREVLPKIFFITGGHGGIIIDDIGFCEFDAPLFALKRLINKMNLAIETNMPYNIEIAISCLQWLKNRYPEEFSHFTQLFRDGRFEIINPSYTQPYNLIIGAESNIKQYEYGLKVLRQLKLECNIFYASECSQHPQIPQILKGFGINFCSLRTRLLGMCPTTISGNIDWVGLDYTKIQTITDQSGVFNGEYWHGTFFQEFPDLLFQAVSRPFINYLVYSSIEDFIVPLPYQESIWKVSKFSKIFGKFILCSEFFQLIEKDGEFKFSRDSFSLGDYIFIQGELFLNNKNCEIDLIFAEIINCVLNFYNEDSNDSLFENIWKKFLLTQAHDNYAVPFVRNGDYSVAQLSAEEFQKLELNPNKISISQLSINIQKEIQNQCKNFIVESLSKLAKHLGENTINNNPDRINILVFNPTAYMRNEIVSIPFNMESFSGMILEGDNGEILNFTFRNSTLKFISKVPSIGYKLYSFVKRKGVKNSASIGDYFYKINITEEKDAIEISFKGDKICELHFDSKYDYKLEVCEHEQDSVEDRQIIYGKIQNDTFKMNIVQASGVNRLEFSLDSKLLDYIILNPTLKVSETLINYPFGIEKTKRSQFQTLDFLWLKGKDIGLIYIQKNCQKFTINRKSFSVRNLIAGNGSCEFAIAITNNCSLDTAYYHTKTYLFKLFGLKIDNVDNSMKRSQSYLSLKSPIIFENLWRRGNKSYLRVLNPNHEQNVVELGGLLINKQLREIDLNYEELRTLENGKYKIDPWKILTLEI
jgi:hypothetical protein